MSQRVLTIPNTSGNTLIVSGTEIMEIPAGHVRSAEAHVPSFATKPDITITIYSDESIPYNPYPEPEEGEADVSNPGVTFVPWSIEPAAVENAHYITIKSPIIGTFYRKPSPDKPMFAEVGSTIAKGDVLCVIEAMKLFNEIESEISGKIVKILVDDMSPVEFDQPLFLVDPS